MTGSGRRGDHIIMVGIAKVLNLRPAGRYLLNLATDQRAVGEDRGLRSQRDVGPAFALNATGIACGILGSGHRHPAAATRGAGRFYRRGHSIAQNLGAGG